MAAGTNNNIRLDPALIKYNNVFVTRHQYFRWTGRTAWLSFAYMIAFPTLIGYVAYTTDGKYQMRGKKRGDPMVEF